MNNKETVSVEVVKPLLEIARDKGRDTAELTAALGFPCNPLDPGGTRARAIDLKLYCRLLQKVSIIAQGKLFGLAGDDNDPCRGFRLMCYSILHAPNLGEAIERAVEFYQLYGDPAWRFSLRRTGEDAAIAFPTGDGDTPLPFGNTRNLWLWHRFWAWLSGQYIELTAADFINRPRSSIETYQRYFKTRLNFEQSENALHFSQRYLDSPIVQTEDSLRDFLDTMPYQLIAMPWDTMDSLTAKVRFIIGCDFTKELPGIQEISSILHISPATLRRKLRREGTTFQQIKNDTRREAAIAYLSRPDVSINTSAYLLGFVDPSAFSRSFKKWTGMPPGAYRKRYLKHQTNMESCK